jgi:hypothetical protein
VLGDGRDGRCGDPHRLPQPLAEHVHSRLDIIPGMLGRQLSQVAAGTAERGDQAPQRRRLCLPSPGPCSVVGPVLGRARRRMAGLRPPLTSPRARWRSPARSATPPLGRLRSHSPQPDVTVRARRDLPAAVGRARIIAATAGLSFLRTCGEYRRDSGRDCGRRSHRPLQMSLLRQRRCRRRVAANERGQERAITRLRDRTHL